MTLHGRSVAVTRDGDRNDPLIRMLEVEGARVLSWSTLEFAEPIDPGPLRTATASLDEYDWLVFTSARAVEALAGALEAPTPDVQIAAVGAATAKALSELGWRVTLVGRGGALDLAQEIAEYGRLEGARVLFPAASLAGSTLEGELAGRGARVERVEAYRTVPSPPDPAQVRADLQREVDVVTFASPSAVHALAEALSPDWPALLESCGIASIGLTTTRALVESGIKTAQTARNPSLAALVQACMLLTISDRT